MRHKVPPVTLAFRAVICPLPLKGGEIKWRPQRAINNTGLQPSESPLPLVGRLNKMAAQSATSNTGNQHSELSVPVLGRLNHKLA